MHGNLQVLQMLAQAYLLNKQAAPALQYVQALQQLNSAKGTKPAVYVVAIQAKIMVSTFTAALH